MAEYSVAHAVSAHYTTGKLGNTILDALRAAGRHLDALTPDDLMLFDQFHIHGREATHELMRLAGIREGDSVLDVGGGLGGPARTLAIDLGCTVTVLDLTEEYCSTGAMLTTRLGLQHRVTFRHGNARDMPFPARRFDVVWMQQCAANIADKAELYAEIHRVLRPGGRLALHEMLAGPNQPIHFPVPWARNQAISFLQTPEAMRTLLHDTGFEERAWVDTTATAIAWFRARAGATGPEPAIPPPLGLHLLLGPDFSTMMQSQIRNVSEGRIVIAQGVFQRR